MKAQKTYRVIASCDPYHARIHYHGEEVIRKDGAIPVAWVHSPLMTSLPLADANDIIFGFVKVVASQYFDNWGLACINFPRFSPGDSCGTRHDGTRYMTDDAMTYSVEQEENCHEER